jgi:tRNA(His) 5'-end guanylyltransferase
MPMMFDARTFNIPREEVINLIYWRQLDAVRNSILGCGQALFSHKELLNKSCADIKEMLIEAGKPWESIAVFKQRGTCCIRENKQWVTDYSMPMLVKEGREYLDAII